VPFKGLAGALRTLTIIPAFGAEPQKRYLILPWFAVVGGVIGALLAGCAEVMRFFPPAMAPLAGLLIASVNYILTGALHLDGFADTADAFGIKHSREKTLEILRDTHIGSFGAGAIVIIIIWRIIVSGELSKEALFWIAVAPVFSRLLLGLLFSFLPYSRGNDGKASGLKGTPLIISLLFIQLAAFIAFTWYYSGFHRMILPFVCGILLSSIPVILSLRRIGGITGDIAGAATELFECAFLTGALALAV